MSVTGAVRYGHIISVEYSMNIFILATINIFIDMITFRNEKPWDTGVNPALSSHHISTGVYAMPKRKDINKVLIIGSGPIIIGQACEFDYSGTQACKALRKLGYEIVLVNSNPATIMTDPGMADVTYIEPLNIEPLEQIIEKEKPDALLPNLGGQTGLNLSSELHKQGVLEKYGVKIIGVEADAIERGEDRIAFKKTMNKLGIEMPESEPAYSVEEAEKHRRASSAIPWSSGRPTPWAAPAAAWSTTSRNCEIVVVPRDSPPASSARS